MDFHVGQGRPATATYGDCPGPVSRPFRPHGLYLRPGDSGTHTLFVVGHGEREAIEVFEVGPNGLEISRDGQWFYVGGYGAQSLSRLSRGRTPVQQEAVEVGFHIDNVRWGPGETLLADGHVGPARASIGQCIRQGQCDGVTSRVSQIDPRSFTAEEVARYRSNDLLILGTVAIQVGDEIWVGGVAEGDRIARFPAPSR